MPRGEIDFVNRDARLMRQPEIVAGRERIGVMKERLVDIERLEKLRRRRPQAQDENDQNYLFHINALLWFRFQKEDQAAEVVSLAFLFLRLSARDNPDIPPDRSPVRNGSGLRFFPANDTSRVWST